VDVVVFKIGQIFIKVSLALQQLNCRTTFDQYFPSFIEPHNSHKGEKASTWLQEEKADFETCQQCRPISSDFKRQKCV
jgi:hypothetical protein